MEYMNEEARRRATGDSSAPRFSEENSESTTSVNRVVLLPCPFCGSQVEVEQHAFNKKYYAECRCSVESCTDQFDTQEKVANAWNRRRSTGLVNWLEAEMQKWREGLIGGPMAECKFQELKRCRKMVKRLLGQ